jgi:hypothetical protein
MTRSCKLVLGLIICAMRRRLKGGGQATVEAVAKTVVFRTRGAGHPVIRKCAVTKRIHTVQKQNARVRLRRAHMERLGSPGPGTARQTEMRYEKLHAPQQSKQAMHLGIQSQCVCFVTCG